MVGLRSGLITESNENSNIRNRFLNASDAEDTSARMISDNASAKSADHSLLPGRMVEGTKIVSPSHTIARRVMSPRSLEELQLRPTSIASDGSFQSQVDIQREMLKIMQQQQELNRQLMAHLSAPPASQAAPQAAPTVAIGENHRRTPQGKPLELKSIQRDADLRAVIKGRRPRVPKKLQHSTEFHLYVEWLRHPSQMRETIFGRRFFADAKSP